MSTENIGTQLVELCSQGKNLEAVDKLYDKNVVSIEVVSMPDLPAEMKGIDAVRKKNQWWLDNHIVHGAEVKGPYPHGDRFAVYYKYDATNKSTNERIKMDEVGLYTVKADKIVKEEYFYSPGADAKPKK